VFENDDRFFIAYQCEQCGGIYRAQQDDSADKEAKERFGVDNAMDNPDMAIVCDECYQALMRLMNN
jgi:hypothetical protein